MAVRDLRLHIFMYGSPCRVIRPCGVEDILLAFGTNNPGSNPGRAAIERVSIGMRASPDSTVRV